MSDQKFLDWRTPLSQSDWVVGIIGIAATHFIEPSIEDAIFKAHFHGFIAAGLRGVLGFVLFVLLFRLSQGKNSD